VSPYAAATPPALCTVWAASHESKAGIAQRSAVSVRGCKRGARLWCYAVSRTRQAEYNRSNMLPTFLPTANTPGRGSSKVLPPACRHAQPFLPDTWACNCHTDTRLVVARFDTAERSQFCTCMLAQDKTDDSSTRQSASAPAANASALVVARRRLRAPAGSYVRLADPSLVHDASTLTPLHHLA